MLVEFHRDFRIEPAPLKIRYNGVTGYKARAFVSQNSEHNRRHFPVTDHGRFFDSQDTALQQSLAIARRWIDAKNKVGQCVDRKDVRNVQSEPPDPSRLPFTHRAIDALKAPWQRLGTNAPRRRHLENHA